MTKTSSSIVKADRFMGYITYKQNLLENDYNKSIKKKGKEKERGNNSQAEPENRRKIKFRLLVRRCKGYRPSDGGTLAYQDVFHPECDQ